MLAQLLDSAVPGLEAAAVTALRRLSMVPALAAEVAVIAGVPTCLRLLRDSHSFAVHAAAAAQLSAQIAGSDERRRAAVAAGAVPLLVRCLLGVRATEGTRAGAWWPTYVPSPVQYAVARAIDHVTDGQPCAGVQHSGLVQLVGQLGGSQGASAQEHATTAVYILSQQPSSSLMPDGIDPGFAWAVKLQLLARCGTVLPLLKLLQDGSSQDQRDMAASILANIARKRISRTACRALPHAEQLMWAEFAESGGVAALLSIVRDGSARASNSAMAILKDLSQRSIVQHALVAAGGCEIIVRRLQQADADIAFTASRCFEHLAEGPPAVWKAALAAGTLPALQSALLLNPGGEDDLFLNSAVWRYKRLRCAAAVPTVVQEAVHCVRRRTSEGPNQLAIVPQISRRVPCQLAAHPAFPRHCCRQV